MGRAACEMPEQRDLDRGGGAGDGDRDLSRSTPVAGDGGARNRGADRLGQLRLDDIHRAALAIPTERASSPVGTFWRAAAHFSTG